MQRQKIEGCKMVEMRQTSHETFTTVCSFIMTFSKLAATVFQTEKKTNFGSNFWLPQGSLKEAYCLMV